MKTYVFMDIDDTIADASRRYAEAGPAPALSEGREVFDAWLSKVQNAESLAADDPIVGMKAICNAFSFFEDFGGSIDFFYLTAREEKWRRVTQDWLRKHNFADAPVLMGPNGYWKKSGELKEQMIKDVLPPEPVNVVVFDDDKGGCIEEACRRNGWTFLKSRVGVKHD